jgi:biotin carboxylase
VIAKGNTRAQAIGRVTVALQAFNIQGVQTNVALLVRVLQDSEFLAGNVDTGIVERILRASRKVTAL